MKNLLAILLLAGAAFGQISSLTLPHVIDTASVPRVSYVDDNDAALRARLNIVIDSVNLYLGAGFTGTILKSNTNLRLTIDNDANATGNVFALTHNGSTDTLFKVTDDSTAYAKKLQVAGRTTLADSAIGTSARLSGTIALGGNEAHDYDEGTFTCTIGGFTTTVSGTCRFTRTGKAVVLFMPNMTGTSNATTMVLTGMPGSITPARAALIPGGHVLDNAGDFPCAIFYDGAGTFNVDLKATIGGAYNFNGFTNSGTKGFSVGQFFSYNLN